MSEKLEDKTVELLDRSAEAVEVFASKLSTLAESYGPEVADVAMAAARIDAASGLITGLVLLGFAIVLSVLSWRILKSGHRAYQEGSAYSDDGAFRLIVGALIGLVSGVLMIIACVDGLFSVWRWAGVIQPELWIAKTVLGL